MGGLGATMAVRVARRNSCSTTYGGYLGFERTNGRGVAGYIRAGYQVREVGRLPSKLTQSDGYTTVEATGNTIDLDYSGFYFKVGIGYDLAH